MKEKKIATNLSMPLLLLDEYKAIRGRVGGKEHWAVVSAAMLMMAEARSPIQDYYLQQVNTADGPGGSWKDLIELAKRGKLRDLAEHYAAELKKRQKLASPPELPANGVVAKRARVPKRG